MLAYPWSTRYQQSNQWAIETLAYAMEPTSITRERAQAWLARAEGRGDESKALFARALAEQLAAGLGTERVAVFPWDQNLNPTCRVLIDVLSMGGDLGKEATLSARWTLLDTQGKRPEVVRRSDFRETPADAGYHAWVAAQQRNIARLGQEITAAVKALPK